MVPTTTKAIREPRFRGFFGIRRTMSSTVLVQGGIYGR